MNMQFDKSYRVNRKTVQPIQKTYKITPTKNGREENNHKQDSEKKKSQKEFKTYFEEAQKNKKSRTISQKERFVEEQEER